MSQKEVCDQINSSFKRMTIAQRRLWETIRIDPGKWQQHPFGDQGEGFWAVAILGTTVVWYNDIEAGFSKSKCSKYGEIDAYWRNQDQLEWTLQHLLSEIMDGQPSRVYLEAPEPIV